MMVRWSSLRVRRRDAMKASATGTICGDNELKGIERRSNRFASTTTSDSIRRLTKGRSCAGRPCQTASASSFSEVHRPPEAK